MRGVRDGIIKREWACRPNIGWRRAGIKIRFGWLGRMKNLWIELNEWDARRPNGPRVYMKIRFSWEELYIPTLEWKRIICWGRIHNKLDLSQTRLMLSLYENKVWPRKIIYQSRVHINLNWAELSLPFSIRPLYFLLFDNAIPYPTYPFIWLNSHTYLT